jgi:translocator protein
MRARQYVNVIGLVLVLVVNWLANAAPLNGQTTGEVSADIPTLFTPAAYVFSIWGLIYLGLIAFAVYQALPAQRDAGFIDNIGCWFAATCLLNAGWIFAWHYERFVWTQVVMVGLLICLLVIYERLGIGRKNVESGVRWLVHMPFSLYLAWISVATIANTSVLLTVLGWDGWGVSTTLWTIAVILVGGGLGLLMLWRRGEVAYPLVIVWAFVGIVVRRSDVLPIALTAGAVAVLLLVLLGVRWFRAERVV